jgi:uncharacterized protein (DUF736 family)
MAIIGRFKHDANGYIGLIETLTFRTDARFVKRDKGANFSIIGPHSGELGAAWRKTGEFGDYLSVRLDGPTLPAPINATMTLKPTEGGEFFLRWQRREPSSRNSPTESEAARP